MIYGMGVEVGVGNFATQEFCMLLRTCCGSLAEAVIFPSKNDNGQLLLLWRLRRRRINAKAAQRDLKVLAREIP